MRINNLGNIQTAIEFAKADQQASTVWTYNTGGTALTSTVSLVGTSNLWIAGNFVETVWSVSLSWTGMATVTGTPTPQQMGLIARKTALGDYTANVVVVTGKTNNLDLTNANRDQNLSSVVIDGSVSLPY